MFLSIAVILALAVSIGINVWLFTRGKRPDLKQSENTIKSRELSIKNAARGNSQTITGQLTSNFSHREAQSSTENYGANININIPII